MCIYIYFKKIANCLLYSSFFQLLMFWWWYYSISFSPMRVCCRFKKFVVCCHFKNESIKNKYDVYVCFERVLCLLMMMMIMCVFVHSSVVLSLLFIAAMCLCKICVGCYLKIGFWYENSCRLFWFHFGFEALKRMLRISIDMFGLHGFCLLSRHSAMVLANGERFLLSLYQNIVEWIVWNGRC